MHNNTTQLGPNDAFVHSLNSYYLILLSISVMICITNCLVLTLFLTQASLRSTANYLLFSLAISDLAVGLVGIPVSIVCSIMHTWAICLTSYTLNRFIAVSTIYHILWITLEKYSAIVYPLRHKSQFDQKKVNYICAGTWSLSTLLSVVELSWIAGHDDPYVAFSESIKRKQMIYNAFIFTVVFVFPMAVMAFAYVSIFLRILRQHSHGEFLRKHRTRRKAVGLHARVPRNVKSALLFFVILLVFVASWFWWFFLNVYLTIFNGPDLSAAMYDILTALRFSTSFVNPVLYTFFKRDFNKAVRKRLAIRSHITPSATQQRLTRAGSHSEATCAGSSRNSSKRNQPRPSSS